MAGEGEAKAEQVGEERAEELKGHASILLGEDSPPKDGREQDLSLLPSPLKASGEHEPDGADPAVPEAGAPVRTRLRNKDTIARPSRTRH